MTKREETLLTTLGKLTGLPSIRRAQVDIWLEAARKLPANVPTEEIVLAMTWAVAHKYWTRRASDMPSFVSSFDQLMGEYRGDVRKQKLESGADAPVTPEEQAIRDLYDPMSTTEQIIYWETRKRTAEATAKYKAACLVCHGQEYILKPAHENRLLRDLWLCCTPCTKFEREYFAATFKELTQTIKLRRIKRD